MTLLHEAFEAKKFDVRLLEKNVTRSNVTSGDVEQYLKQLPDDAENAEYISLEAIMNDGEVVSHSSSDEEDSEEIQH